MASRKKALKKMVGRGIFKGNNRQRGKKKQKGYGVQIAYNTDTGFKIGYEKKKKRNVRN